MSRRTEPRRRPERRRNVRPLIALALIVAAALPAYIPAFRAGFVWDDDNFLTENRLVRSSNGLYRIWFTKAPRDYFPLTSSLMWIEWRLWGMHAAGYHVVNLLLHAASAVLLWRVLLSLKVRGAWLAGMLFAVHPVAAASAAWITEGKNTLSMALCLGSLLAWERSQNAEGAGSQSAERRMQNAERQAGCASRVFGSAFCTLPSAFCVRSYFLSLILFLLALLAKTSVVMLPVVLLLLGWWKRGKPGAKDLLRVAPFFALSLILGLVTIWYQWNNAIGQEVVRAEGAVSRIASAGWVSCFYLYKILLPVRLCAVYPRWEVDPTSLISFLPLILVIGATVVLWAGRKRWGAGPLVAWASFLILLLPVMGLVSMSFMRLSLVADHLQYAAMPAILALVAALLTLAGGRWPAKALIGLCVAGLIGLTIQRAWVFSSNVRLWSDNAQKTPRSPRILCELGMAHRAAGELSEAIACFDRSLELDPKYVHGWLDRGIARADAKRLAEAIGDYNQAIALQPDLPDAWYNRGNAWFDMRRFDEALRDLDEAIRLRPNYTEAYVNRGLVHSAQGHPADAVRDYDKAIEIYPDCAQAYVNRGLIRAAEGHSAEAMSDFNQAIERQPDCVEARYNRGTAYARAGRLAEALRDLDQAIALKPDYVEAYINRGNVYLAARHYAEAIGDYGRAIACDPRNANAWYRRAHAEMSAGRPEDAIPDLDRLVELTPQDAKAFYERGLAHRSLKQTAEALADFERARQLGMPVPEELLREPAPSAPPVR